MKRIQLLKGIGPGIVMAATGLGAGDLVAATVAGKHLGGAVIWAIVVGALFKFILNEALARWQLQTGETLLQSWCTRLPRWFRLLFFAYLLVWATLVGAALMAACGLAAHSILPVLSVPQWAALHSLVAVLLIRIGHYQSLEICMKWLIGLMFVSVLCAFLMMEGSFSTLLRGILNPVGPQQSLGLVLGVIGGVGGSVTLLCYSYWMREKAWRKPEHINQVRVDLAAAYIMTALFGICVVVLSAIAQPDISKGSQVIIDLSQALGASIGEPFRLIFLWGFWGAVFSSMLGVWQGVPYLFRDIIGHDELFLPIQKRSRSQQLYHAGLYYLGSVPLMFLLVDKPIWLVMVYSIAGAFFIPFLAVTLGYLQWRFYTVKNKVWVVSQAAIAVTLLFFLALAVSQLGTN